MRAIGRKKRMLLILMAALALALPLWIRAHPYTTPVPETETMLAARDRMQACMDAVKAYKTARGIPIDPAVDFFATGVLGGEYSPITTTLGALSAKRTSANPDMAAMLVRLLAEAGVTAGSRVAACFSGSFPGLAIATVTACDAMGAELVIVSSVGASTYGANQPGLTMPEMLHLLYRDGLILEESAGITWGGGQDAAGGMFPFPEDAPVRAAIEARFQSSGLVFHIEEDYEKNIAWRMALYGDVDCFVNAGGNVAGLGRGGRGYAMGEGLLEANVRAIDGDSGLIEQYLYRGVPVVHLLNVKRLVADYGMPFDPPALPMRGESPVYFETRYHVWAILVSAALLLAGVLAYRSLNQKEKRAYEAE